MQYGSGTAGATAAERLPALAASPEQARAFYFLDFRAAFGVSPMIEYTFVL